MYNKSLFKTCIYSSFSSLFIELWKVNRQNGYWEKYSFSGVHCHYIFLNMTSLVCHYHHVSLYLSLSSGCWCVYLLWEVFFFSTLSNSFYFNSHYCIPSPPFSQYTNAQRTVRSPPALRCLCPPPFFNIKIPPLSSLVAATTSDSITNAENIFSFSEIINLFPTNFDF